MGKRGSQEHNTVKQESLACIQFGEMVNLAIYTCA